MAGGLLAMGSSSKESRAIDRTGEVLDGKYVLKGRLGSGGMGAVYEATHNFVGRRFAVKFLHPDMAERDEIMARFKNEARAAGSLESENIVAVTDFGEAADGAPYLVMEHLDGEDLASLLSRHGRLPVRRALNIVIQACRGLEAAHGRGIVHRDLKPDNLFIVKRGDGSDLTKILDFGIAKLRAGQGVDTVTGTLIGTLSYMPPEQVRGDKGTDHRADVYALGCILYQALGGEVPHPGDEPHNVLYHLMHEPPKPLDGLRDDLPAGLCAVVHRAIAFDVMDRYQSVVDFAAHLEPLAGRDPAAFRSNAPDSEPLTWRRPLPPMPAPRLPKIPLPPTVRTGAARVPPPPRRPKSVSVEVPHVEPTPVAPTTPDGFGTTARHSSAMPGSGSAFVSGPPVNLESRSPDPAGAIHWGSGPGRVVSTGTSISPTSRSQAGSRSVRNDSRPLRERLREPQVVLGIGAALFATAVIAVFAVSEIIEADDAPPPPIPPPILAGQLPEPPVLDAIEEAQLAARRDDSKDAIAAGGGVAEPSEETAPSPSASIASEDTPARPSSEPGAR